MSPPILSYPSQAKLFILDTDASNCGIGAVLSQVQSGEEKVIIYFSKVFINAEKNYCVTRRELLAVARSVVNYHHYLVGRRITIRPDHASLHWLLSFENPEDQIARRLEVLFQYDFEIIHCVDRNHENVDSLSRRPCAVDDCKKRKKFEQKNQDIEKSGYRMICNINHNIDWIEFQDKDSTVKVIKEYKKEDIHPEWSDISHLEASFKLFLLH